MAETNQLTAYTTDRWGSVLFLLAESPVHAGASEGKGVIDLPIQRSVQTEWPILNDSTFRGGLRARIRQLGDGLDDHLFGTETGPAEGRHPGWFSTPDAEILLFPVASPTGLTAWVTCSRAIQMFVRKAKLAAGAGILPGGSVAAIQQLETIATAIRPLTDKVYAGGTALRLNPNGKAILESDAFDVESGDAGKNLAGWIVQHALPLADKFWADYVRERIVIVPDLAFTHYVSRKTDLRTRIHVGERGVADNLFTEENLPQDTLLYTLLMTTDTRIEKSKQYLCDFRKALDMKSRPVVQLGGDQNLGRGMVRLRELEG